MSIEVGSLHATLEVQGLPELERGLTAARGGLQDLGSSATRADSQVRGAMSSSAQAVQKAAAAMQAAQAAQLTSAARLTEAETRLNAVRNQSGATAQQIASAEAATATARARVSTSAVQAAEAQNRLNEAQSRASQGSQQVADAARQAAQATDQASESTRRHSQSQRESSESSSVLSRSLGSVKDLAMEIGPALSGAAVVEFFRRSVMAASDLNESMNAVDTIFKGAAGSIYTFADGATRQLGMSNLAAREAAATFGIYGQQANLATDENAKFSVKMASLAGDMASFRNTSPEQAIEAIGAAFRGESDPIEAYGVLINETTLKNRAMADGLIDNTADALEPAVRVQAAYNEILSQTTYMQGDFAKTSDSLSNRIKTLSADFTNTSAAIGEKLMPLAQGFVSLLAGPGMGAMSGFGSALGVAAKLAETLAGAFSNLPAPLQQAIGAIVAMKVGAAALGTEAGQGLVEKMEGAKDSIIEFAQGAVGAARGGMTSLRTAFTDAGGGARSLTGNLRAAGTVGMAGLRAGASSLVGFLGGPWGLAFTAATMLVGQFTEASAKAAAHQEQIGSAVGDLSQELYNTGGIYTETGKKAAAAALESIKLADDSKTLGKALQDAGISGNQAADGLAGMRDAAKKTREELSALAEKEKDGLGAWGKFTQGFSDFRNGRMGMDELFVGDGDYGTEAQLALEAYDDAAAKIKEKQDELKREAANGGDVVFSKSGVAAAGAMSDAMEEFTENTKGAAQGVKILSGALDQLRGDSLTLEDSMQNWNDGIDSLAEAAGKVNAPLYGMNGALNTANDSVSAFYSSAKDTASSMAAVAAATYQQTGSLDAVRNAVTPLYDEFVRVGTAAGIPLPAIQQLAGQLHILPSQIPIEITSNFPNATRLAEELAGKVYEIPNDKTIKVQDNTPETIQKFKDLGYEVNVLPEGWIEVKTNAPDAGAAIDAEANRPRTATITIDTVRTAQAQRDFNASGQYGPVAPVLNGRANGGVDFQAYANGKLPGVAEIKPPQSRLIQWAEPETGGEAFIPLAGSKRGRSTAILAKVADMFGYSLEQFANGGIAGERAVAYAQSRNGDPYVYASADSDCSAYQSAIYNKLTGQSLRFTTGSDFAKYGFEKGYDPNGYSIGTDNGVGTNGHMAGTLFGVNVEADGSNGIQYGGSADGAEGFPSIWHLPGSKFDPAWDGGDDPSAEKPDTRTEKQKITDAIVAEGKRRGISDKGIKTAIATGLAESDLQDLPDAPNSEFDSSGVFQQRPSMGWGPAGEGAAKDANDFYDALQKIDYENMSEAQAAQAVQKSAFSDGSNYAAKMGEADTLLAESIARSAKAQDGGSKSAESSSGTGQAVYVTNWPSSYSSSSGSSSSSSSSSSSASSSPAPAKADANKDSYDISTVEGRAGLISAVGAKFFANGGIENHTALIAKPGQMRVWAEPETGGEAYIPLAPGKRARSMEILAETARRMGMAVVSEEAAKVFKGDPKSLTDETDPTGWRALLGGDYNGKLSKLGIEEDNPAVAAVLSARRMIAEGNYDGFPSQYGIEEDHPLVDALLRMNTAFFADGGFGGVSGANDHTSGSWKAISGAGAKPSSLSTPLRDTRLLKARDQGYQLGAFGVGAALTVASAFDGKGNFTGNFNTGNTSIPGLEDGLKWLAEIAQKPTVVIQNAEIKADNPEELANQAMDPSRMPFLQTGI